jgi:MoaA/NifB/PqqE/SkfB family radical SAM enzyme
MELLVRKEAFGYLFIDTADERLFVVKTTNELDFSDTEHYEFTDRIGQLVTPKRIELRPSKIIRDDILCAPTYVEFYPTLNCNERCHFCYVGDILNGNGAQFKAEYIEPFLENLASAGVFQIVILGGDPLAYRHLSLLLDKAFDKKFIVSLSTNGTYDRPDIWEKVIAYDVHLNISIHSHIPEIEDQIVGKTGAFYKVIQTIKKIAKRGVAPHISIVVTHENHSSVADTVDFLCSLGVQSISLFNTAKTGNARNTLNKYVDFATYRDVCRKAAEKANHYRAIANPTTNFPFLVNEKMKFELTTGLNDIIYGSPDGRRVLFILNDGTITTTLYQNLKKPAIVGNAITDDFALLWADSPVLNELRNRKPKVACLQCSHFEYCRGGHTTNLRDTEDDQTLPDCPMFYPLLVAE